MSVMGAREKYLSTVMPALFARHVDGSRTLADSRQPSPMQAGKLARKPETIAYVDGGLHLGEAAHHRHPTSPVHQPPSSRTIQS